MKNLKNLSICELKNLKVEIEKELNTRENMKKWGITTGKAWEGETYIS